MFKLTAYNVRKIILSLRASGRKVDVGIVLHVWRKYYRNAIWGNLSMTQICDQFRASIWNRGAVK